MTDLELASLLFIAGLMGSGHCLGMCGGLSSALGMSTGGSRSHQLTLLLIAQFGRVLSYALIGSLFGGSLWVVKGLFDIKPFLMVISVLANLMIIAMGFYIAGWWFGLKRLERFALPLWKRLQPLQKRFLPMQSVSDAFVVGIIWGWLPCGLVYSALVTTVSATHHYSAGFCMLAFGLGTLPSVWLAGSAAAWFRQLLQYQPVRLFTGFVLFSYGINQLIQIIKTAS